MRTLIVYCSSHGTTKKAAEKLKDLLEGPVQLVDLKAEKEPKLDSFDAVIIGGSIHAGHIQMKLKKFMDKQAPLLLAKRLGLFLCCMREGEIAEEQFNRAFPERLREHAITHGLFGGEFLVSKMNIVERKIIRKVNGVTKETSKLSEPSIKEFATSFQKQNDKQELRNN